MRQVGVNAHNDAVAQIVVVAAINTHQESVRINLESSIIAANLGATPAVTNLTTNVATGPGKDRARNCRNRFFIRNGVSGKCSICNSKDSCGCKKDRLDIHRMLQMLVSVNQLLSRF